MRSRRTSWRRCCLNRDLKLTEEGESVLQEEGTACAKALSQAPRYWRIRKKIRVAGVAGVGGMKKGRAQEMKLERHDES